MDSTEGFEISKKCVVGLSVLKPIKNYVGSYSTKIFEYMAIGLPVITSNFPLYQNVVERYNCGYCVAPYSSQELADRIEELISNSELTNQMGANGQLAVKDKFSWSSEEEKLIDLYKEVL
jgi:glycosyltransferase involved in cell wall biosynthesis